ncbi:hypothetical protein NL676_019005 [Syzygium grande]|nr:hypothetical protein NL676_019005 [Syzygium grande]
MAGSSALLTLATMVVLLAGLAVAQSPVPRLQPTPRPSLPRPRPRPLKAFPPPSPTAATTPPRPASAPSPHDPAAAAAASHVRGPCDEVDVAGGTKREDVEADPPSGRAGIGGQRRYIAVGRPPITILTPVSASALIIAGSAPYSLTFPIVVDPRSPAVDFESGLDEREAPAPFPTRLDLLDKSDEIQLKSCKFRYSTNEESTQRERGGREHWSYHCRRSAEKAKEENRKPNRSYGSSSFDRL